MNADLLVMGIVIGISIAAPVGPIGILCIRRSLTRGRIAGFVSGLGAATADLLYGCVIGSGLTIISDPLIGQERWLYLIGGGILICLGIWTFSTKPSGNLTPESRNGLLRAYSSTFLLTLLNPVTIILFTGIMAGLGVGQAGFDLLSVSILVSGIFFGSLLWWAILSFGIGTVRDKIPPGTLLWVNRISGIILTGFGIAALGTWI
jgi:threonine/homoserine/homoserine lactone efflux protein